MNVNIHQSEIDHAGQGLFVNNNHTFRKGDIICPYEGELVEYDIATDLTYESDYRFEVKENEWVIDAKDTETFGKYANDPIDEDLYNCHLIANNNLTALLIATKRIGPGKEIYVEYDENFWHHYDHFDSLSQDHKSDLYERGSAEFRDWIDLNYT